jgi:hypothetical protein
LQLADYYWWDGSTFWIGDAKYKRLAKDQQQALRFRDLETEENDPDSAPLAGQVLSPADVRQLTVYAQLVQVWSRLICVFARTSRVEHVIEQCGTVTKAFGSERKAIAYFHQVRDELEKSLPPRKELSDEERQELLEKYLADNPTPRTSLNENTPKKASKSRRFG